MNTLDPITSKLIDDILDLQDQIDALPDLPPNEQIKLEFEMAIDHLYYSSALEGIHLSTEQLREATFPTCI